MEAFKRVLRSSSKLRNEVKSVNVWGSQKVHLPNCSNKPTSTITINYKTEDHLAAVIYIYIYIYIHFKFTHTVKVKLTQLTSDYNRTPAFAYRMIWRRCFNHCSHWIENNPRLIQMANTEWFEMFWNSLEETDKTKRKMCKVQMTDIET